MKPKLLVYTYEENHEPSEVNFTPYFDDIWGIIMYQISTFFELHLCGYNSTPKDTSDYLGSICLNHVKERLDKNILRPTIGLPDHEFMYSINDLSEFDGVIAITEDIYIDSVIAKTPVELIYGVNFKNFNSIEKQDCYDKQLQLISNWPTIHLYPTELRRILDGLNITILSHYEGDGQKNAGIEFQKDFGMDNAFQRVDIKQYINLVWNSFGGSNINKRPYGLGKVAVKAALGDRISIGGLQEYQKMLYPKLSSTDWRVLRENLIKLIDSNTFYEECVGYAKEKVTILDMNLYTDKLITFIRGIYNV